MSDHDLKKQNDKQRSKRKNNSTKKSKANPSFKGAANKINETNTQIPDGKVEFTTGVGDARIMYKKIDDTRIFYSCHDSSKDFIHKIKEEVEAGNKGIAQRFNINVHPHAEFQCQEGDIRQHDQKSFLGLDPGCYLYWLVCAPASQGHLAVAVYDMLEDAYDEAVNEYENEGPPPHAKAELGGIFGGLGALALCGALYCNYKNGNLGQCWESLTSSCSNFFFGSSESAESKPNDEYHALDEEEVPGEDEAKTNTSTPQQSNNT